ncbi:MAG: hypothetical protein ACRDUX_39290, partial [Mycobacterium sp.]
LKPDRVLIGIVAALFIWALLLPGMSGASDSALGLMFSTRGFALVPVVVVLVVAFVLAIRAGRNGTALLTVAAVVVVLRVTATLITDLPLYPWTYKHVGIVDYLLQNHVLPPSGVDVYRDWPAFFTAFAWFSEITSADPVLIAHWFAPVTHVVLALMVGCLAMTIGLNGRQALVAVLLVETANWVGQDYFSPQAFALPVAVGTLTLLIASRTTPAAGWLAFLAFAALVPMHQLTPYWVFGIVFVLVATRMVGPLWLPIPYALLLFGYLYPRRDVLVQNGLFSGLNPLANASSGVEFDSSAAKMFTSLACRGLSAAVVLLAVVALVFWWRQGRPLVTPAIIAFTSFALLFLNSYGGEAIYRVYLYALPGCAILIAPILVDTIGLRAGGRGRHPSNHAVGGLHRGYQARHRKIPDRRHHVAAAGVLLSCIAVAGLQGYYGTWSMVVQTRSQLSLFTQLAKDVSGPVTFWNLHSEGIPDRPTAKWVSLAQYHADFDTPIFDRWPDFAVGFPDGTQFDDVTSLAVSSGEDTYFAFTDQAIEAVGYLGITSSDSARKFEDEFRNSPSWVLRYREKHTRIYQFYRPAIPLTAPQGSTGEADLPATR